MTTVIEVNAMTTTKTVQPHVHGLDCKHTSTTTTKGAAPVDLHLHAPTDLHSLMCTLRRSNRVWGLVSNRIGMMHPALLKRFCEMMHLGYPVLPYMTLDVEDVHAHERRTCWTNMAMRSGDLAGKISWPVRMREGETIVGHVIAAKSEGGNLHGLCVWLEPGEEEMSRSFRERCREALQTHGVVPVQLG